jgi:chromosome segregation ATPase
VPHPIDLAKLENGRLHNLASQIQANLEHYQQAIQQQQVEYNLAKEKQHAVYAQEMEQLKIALEEARKQHDLCEKELADKRPKLEKALADHDKLSENYEALSTKNQEVKHTLIQLQAHELSWEKYREETNQALLTERQLTQSLSQQAAVLTDQLQRAQKDLQKAEDKIETLRHEKMFLVQEKGQLDGALKQLQGSVETRRYGKGANM